ncbi:DMT family transporter [Variovorax sp.]|uniref:DMT family transporter n=1 Tax=Variovorax sp. TaxID=1871043 RepID=UPI0037D9BC56
MVSATDNRRGIATMLLAMACYTLNDALVKLVAAHMGPGQILALRGLCASAIVLAIAARAGVLSQLPTLRRPIVAVRALLEIATAFASVLALARMPLSTVTALMLTAPLLVAVISMATGMEPRRADRVLAAAVGFAGVLLILRPSLDVSASGLAFALACAACLAARDLVTRRIPARTPTPLIASVTTLAVTAAGFALAATPTSAPWKPLAPGTLAWIAGAAFFTAIGNYALIVACRNVDLSTVSPFRYSSILWAMLLGYMFLGEVPDWRVGIGVALITAAGTYTLRAFDRR